MKGHALMFGALWIGTTSICICELYAAKVEAFDYAERPKAVTNSTVDPRRQIFQAARQPERSSLFAGQPMYVAICNTSDVPETVVSHAKREIILVFSAAGADIRWVECVDVSTAKAELGNQLFVVRLLSGGPRSTSRNVALDMMGRAYTNERGSGYLADAYVPSINMVAEQYGVERASFLGLVISHELGHLLLGPGHVLNGLMCGNWKSREIAAIRKRWLRFDSQQAAIILRELEKRAEEKESEHAGQN